MRRWRKPGEQQNRIVACRVQRPPALICNTSPVQLAAAPKGERIGKYCETPGVPATWCCRIGHSRIHGSGSLPSGIPSKSGVER